MFVSMMLTAGWWLNDKEYRGSSRGGVELITPHLADSASFFLCIASDHAMRQAHMIAMRSTTITHTLPPADFLLTICLLQEVRDAICALTSTSVHGGD